MAEIRGVNLGNWLVLEQWMNPLFFEGIDPEHYDETHFCLQRGEAKYTLLKEHRDTFITRKDFERIRDMGLNSVRIPVPHWVFDDCSPYVGCQDYLDNAMEWAKETGLSVLIDLHTAPGCQNGFDNGGILGVCEWHTSAAYIARTEMVLEKLAARYASHPALYGIELLNEPHWDVPADTLRGFYLRAYAACRRHMDTSKAIVLHDQFRPLEWAEFMVGPAYANVVLDTHMYQCFTQEMNAMTGAQHIAWALDKRSADLAVISRSHPVIVGEWSLGLSDNASIQAMSREERMLLRRAYADAQLLTGEGCLGWYFWSYKLLNEGAVDWDYQRLYDRGVMPNWRGL